jgi:outer membrane protein assembly factor BamB
VALLDTLIQTQGSAAVVARNTAARASSFACPSERASVTESLESCFPASARACWCCWFLTGGVLQISADGRLVWSIYVGSVVSSPAVGEDGTIYFGSGDRNVWAVTDGGMTRWRYTTPMPVVASAHCTSEAVYIGDRNGTMYKVRGWFADKSRNAMFYFLLLHLHRKKILYPKLRKFCVQFNLDGSVAWRFATKGEIWGTPRTTRDGRVVFGSMDKTFYCVSDTDGTLIWAYDAQQEIAGTPLIQVLIALCFDLLYGCFNSWRYLC